MQKWIVDSTSKQLAIKFINLWWQIIFCSYYWLNCFQSTDMPVRWPTQSQESHRIQCLKGIMCYCLCIDCLFNWLKKNPKTAANGNNKIKQQIKKRRNLFTSQFRTIKGKYFMTNGIHRFKNTSLVRTLWQLIMTIFLRGNYNTQYSCRILSA